MRSCWILGGFGLIALLALATAMPAVAGRGESALIIFDTSGSMRWNGQALGLAQLGGGRRVSSSSSGRGSRMASTGMVAPTRFDHAQTLANDVIDEFVSKGYDIGLLVFGQAGCSRIDMMVPLGTPNSAPSVRAIIDGLKPMGLTPIADSLKRATEYIKKGGFKVNEVMLITDGMETCHGDARAAARGLAAIGVKLNVVGLDTSQTMNTELADLAAITGGKFRKQDAVGFGGDKIEAGGSSDVSFDDKAETPPPLPQVWLPPESGMMQQDDGKLLRN